MSCPVFFFMPPQGGMKEYTHIRKNGDLRFKGD